jgi:hypothetical protein
LHLADSQHKQIALTVVVLEVQQVQQPLVQHLTGLLAAEQLESQQVTQVLVTAVADF